MRSRFRHTDTSEDLNVWTAFSDLMSNAFMILTLFLLILFAKLVVEQVKNQSNTPEDNTPPIIILDDKENFRFNSGSAEILPSLDRYIWNQLFNQIEANSQKYKIDVVEIIGHTDGQLNQGSVGNLDVNLEKVASGQLPVQNLAAGSNADLGLMRALAVVNVLRNIQQKTGKLKDLQFRPYSAAQLVLPNGAIATGDRNPDASRRRIEIRFTRLGKITPAQ